MMPSVEFRFGPFLMRPGRRELFADGQAVALNARTFDLLEFLVRHRGRVLSRDEILSAVWAGVTVSDNNLNVQMSALRRALSTHAEAVNLVASLPGRGYKFVGDVEQLVIDQAATASPEVEAGEKSQSPARESRRSRAAVVAAIVCILLIAGIAWSLVTSAPASQPSLSVLLKPIEVSGAQEARTFSVAYSDAIRSRLSLFGDTRVFSVDGEDQGRIDARYVLSGTITSASGGLVLSYVLRNRLTGADMASDLITIPVEADRAALLAVAQQIVSTIRPILFKAELERRQGPPRSAFGYLVAAQVEARGELAPEQVERAIGLLERGLQLDPESVPIRIKLASLLEHRLSISPAENGDQDGERALDLLNTVLQTQPRNSLVLALKAASLVALGRPEAAQTCAELGLAIEPENMFLRVVRVEALTQSGDLKRASEEALAPGFDIDDTMTAQLDFAERDYPGADIANQRELAAEPVARHRDLMTLFQSAILVRLHRDLEARRLLEKALVSLPPAFDYIDALRPSYFDLPKSAWIDMSEALFSAGMMKTNPNKSEHANEYVNR